MLPVFVLKHFTGPGRQLAPQVEIPKQRIQDFACLAFHGGRVTGERQDMFPLR